jgi:hypothetical protein
LKSRIEYHALSYVWGDPDITGDINVNEQRVSVTTNLTDALRHLRKVFPADTVFWVDAICKSTANFY